MRNFKKEKARELFIASLNLDEECKRMEEQDLQENGVVSQYTLELRTEAAGMRVIADDIEDGLIEETEL